MTKPSTYRLAVSWDTLTAATSYKTTLTNTTTGALLGSASVTSPAWVTTTRLPVLSQVTVKVTPLAPRRHGIAASVTTALPDRTAPSGSDDVGYD